MKYFLFLIAFSLVENTHIACANFAPPQVIPLSSRPPPQEVEIVDKPTPITLKLNDKDSNITLQPPKSEKVGDFYFMQQYGPEQGLALDAISSGAIDKLGNIWLGTPGGGVSRFDGNGFTNYTVAAGLANNSVTTVYIDTKGNLWFGTTGGGVSRYDEKSFVTFNRLSGLAGNEVKAIQEDKEGNIWFGTESGISIYDGKALKTLENLKSRGFLDTNIQAMELDSKGNLWFGTPYGASKFDGETFTFFTTKEGLAGDNVLTILEDNKGNIWFGTKSGGISKFDGHSFENFTVKEGLVSNFVQTLFQDKSGTLWIGTNQGLSELGSKSFTNYTKKEGLSNENIKVILEDKAGNLWIGTFGGGLNRFDKKALVNLEENNSLSQAFTRTFLQDKSGALWMGTNFGGLFKYYGQKAINYSNPQGLLSNDIQDILEDKEGSLWLATLGGGLSRFDGKKFINYTTEQGLAGNELRSLMKDSHGNLWIATTSGLSKFDGEAFTNYRVDQGLVNNYARSLTEDKKGNIWIGTYGGGISRFNGKTFTNYTLKDGLLNLDIMGSLLDNKGNIWFATLGGGASRFDGSDFLNFTTKQGLPNDVVYTLSISKEQNLIFGTNEGISLLKGFAVSPVDPKIVVPSQNSLSNEELKKYTPVFEVLNTKRGFPIKDANGSPDNIYLDQEGVLWIGTGSTKTNIVRLDYSNLTKTLDPPILEIKEIQIDNTPVIWGSGKEKKSSTLPVQEVISYGKILDDQEKAKQKDEFQDIQFAELSPLYYIPQDLVLPYNHNNVTFNFAAIEPAKPQNVLYQYKLEGYDKDWSPPSNKTSATFGNIFEGNYTLKLKAQSPYGVWSEPLEYKFKILPPWYRTWWAYLLYAVTTFGSFFAFYRWRTAKLRRQYELAERFVPKKVLELLNKKHLEDVQLGDSVELKITAMFADIRGFTTLSESMTPAQTAQFLNTYTHYMAPLIQENKGFINQFLGDGILALFPEKASDSIDASLRMIETLPLFNKEIEAQGFLPVSVGIGLNSGDAMLFALGVKDRLEASIVSDAINTASRVEGLNKYYKTQLLISDSVYKQLPNPEKYYIRLVDKVVLKGKNTGTRIYEVKSLSHLDSAKLSNYYMAYALYEKGEFAAAEKAFELCLVDDPEDGVVKLLLMRSANFKESGVPEGWDGTLRLDEK